MLWFCCTISYTNTTFKPAYNQRASFILILRYWYLLQSTIMRQGLRIVYCLVVKKKTCIRGQNAQHHSTAHFLSIKKCTSCLWRWNKDTPNSGCRVANGILQTNHSASSPILPSSLEWQPGHIHFYINNVATHIKPNDTEAIALEQTTSRGSQSEISPILTLALKKISSSL